MAKHSTGALAALVLFAALLGAMSGINQPDLHSCEDGIDNDGDGDIDDADGDCIGGFGFGGKPSGSEDGWDVCPVGLGCSPSWPLGGSGAGGMVQCVDGIDNDGDGWIDWFDSTNYGPGATPSCDNNGDDTE